MRRACWPCACTAKRSMQAISGRKRWASDVRRGDQGSKDSRGLPAPGSKISRPSEETHQLRPLLPEKKPEVSCVDGVSFAAGVGFDTPFEVFAPPRHEPMASRRIPQKAKRHTRALLTRVYPGDLLLRLQHVLDQLAGHLFGTDVIGSVGHSLLELLDFFPPRFIDGRFAVAWLLSAFLNLDWF